MAYSIAELQVGGGEVWIAPFDVLDPPTYPTDFAIIGTCSTCEIEPKVDKIEHETPIAGVLIKDDETVIKTGATLKFVCDQINQDTLSMFFFGTKVSTTGVTLMTDTVQEFAIKFVSKAVKGQKWDLTLWRVSIKPSGSFKLIAGKEYNSIPFDAEVLSDLTNNPTKPYGEFVKQSV